jgi:hypothetical protein
MQVGQSPLAFVPFGGEGGPPTPGVAEILFSASAVTILDSPGAAAIGLSAVLSITPDGYYVPAGSIAFSVNIGLHEDFVPIGVISLSQQVPLVDFPFQPRNLFSGYAADGTSLTIPIASLTGLTTAEADAVTGDWREILQAVMLYCVEHHREFQWSDQPRTYDAFKMDLLNSRYFDRHFLFHFYTNMGAPSIAPEP